MIFKNRLAVGLGLFLILPAAAKAATWTQIPNYPDTYIDTADVQNETFPKWAQIRAPVEPVETISLTVAWIGISDSHGNLTAQVEVAFNCQGQMGSLQQVITNDSSQSQFHSFDNTQNFQVSGVPMTDIPPSSMYRNAAEIVCHTH
jgi:hypothetical protein